jgi:hypothetical protein
MFVGERRIISDDGLSGYLLSFIYCPPPITGIYNIQTTVTITNGSYTIGEKPENNDRVLLVKKS